MELICSKKMTEKGYKQPRRTNHSVLLYMNELTHRVVASTGIPGDRFHLGKIIMQSLKDAPDFVMQIDGALDQSETFSSVLERTIRCAIAMRNLGLQRGDVMILMAPNHLDLAIPFYAALYLGVLIAGIDMTLGVQELQRTFDVNKPKIVFCQNDKAQTVHEALKNSNVEAHIITFDKGDQFCNFSDFLQMNINNLEVQDFRPTDLDGEDTIGFLTSTSGTTGLPKSAALSHKNLIINLPHFSTCRFYEFPTFTRLFLLLSPLQWLSAGLQYIMSPILRYTRLQTSAPATRDHIYDLINKYKPTMTFMSPNYISSLLIPGEREKCDFTCFEVFFLAGSLVNQSIMNSLKVVAPQAEIDTAYGVSEVSGVAMAWEDDMPLNCVGKPMGFLRHRLVDPATLKDIREPYVTGELWMKGPTVFKGYYNNPEATKEAFSEDGWFKSGDLMYRDEHHNYYFVDRLKMLLKYRNHQISPLEVEMVILKHPAVYDVVVVGVPDEECGDLPAACVVRRAGYNVTAQEIKDIVKENLTETKQLRGGVVFVDALPMTPTTKVDRRKVKNMVMQMKRE